MHNKPYPKHPFYKSVHVKETCKVAEIADAFNNLRYKVIMTSYDIVNDGKYELVYQIQVVNYFYGPEPLIIFETPNVDEPPITDINVATKIYNDCVQNYTKLVKAETRDFQDIDIYKEKIGYKETQPECCMTCRWCRSDIYHMPTKKFQCVCPKNLKEYNFDVQEYYPPMIDMLRFEHNHGCKIHPYDNSFMPLKLKVMPFGVCNNYEKAFPV